MSRALVLLLSSLLLAACGQSGELYLPDEESRAEAAEIQPGVTPESPPAEAGVPTANSDLEKKK
jgi:predicted small lipoprotein YifL